MVKTVPPNARPAQEKLKAERVELMLARLTGWTATPQRAALYRTFDVGNPHQATAFLTCIASLLAERKGNVTYRKGKVSVWLDGTDGQGLTPDIARLAQRIDRVAGEMQKAREGR